MPKNTGQRCPKEAEAGAGVGGQEGEEAHLGGGERREEARQDPKMDTIVQESLRGELQKKEAGFHRIVLTGLDT